MGPDREHATGAIFGRELPKSEVKLRLGGGKGRNGVFDNLERDSHVTTLSIAHIRGVEIRYHTKNSVGIQVGETPDR